VLRSLFPIKLTCCKNMKRLIEQALGDFEPLSERVRTSHYDLMDPSGAIILPSLWETLLEPYWTIKMVMWPYGEQPPPEEPRPQRPTVPRPMTAASEGDLPPRPPPPPVPMPPSVTPKPRFPPVPREKIAKETGEGCWRTETGSETRSMTTDESSDENSHRSTCQYRLSESFQRYGQQFEETWEAVMARSRLKAQKTILDGTVSVSGQKSREDQTGKALPQPDHGRLVKQTLPCSLAPSHSRSLALCETCHSPLLLTSFSPQAPEIYRISPLRASGQADVQTPPFIPNPSETSPMLTIDGISLQATSPRPRNGTASSASRSPFLRSLFGRSTSSSTKAA
jgi:hypothetical protein